MVLDLGWLSEDLKLLFVNNKHISKYYTGTRSYTVSLERPKQRKMGLKFRTCNVSTICRPWPPKTVARELEYRGSDLAGVREVK